MAKNLIFCFTGTGNSLKAAKDISAVLGDTEIVLMKGEYRFSGKYERIGFAFPNYANGMPKAALEFVKSLDIRPDSADYVFAIVTCGGSGTGICLTMLQSALTPKGIPLHYGKALKMVGNYIAMYDIKANIMEALQSADEELAVYAGEIKDKIKVGIGKAKLSAKLYYTLGNKYFKVKAKKLAVSGSCISCGKCEKLCPTGSITIKNGKPMFAWKTCAQCMACVQWCPHEAINCGKETETRKRYHHPDIQMKELL